jgi:uroporphyrinogen decarboxylase
VKPLIDVLSQRLPYRRPLWIMRQAGRYLPEYRAVRAKAGSFLGLCYDPAAAAEVTLQPLRRFDIDAAIVFSDILVVPHAMGLSLDFQEGEGPLLSTVSNMAEVRALQDLAASWQVKRVCETLTRVKAELKPEKALIGFCGAPWTVASYMIEGRSSNRSKALQAASVGSDWFVALIDRLVEASIEFLSLQIAAGAEVVQIFDSWAGDLPARERQTYVINPIARIVSGIRSRYPGFPVIVFARGVGGHHGEVATGTEASAVGVEEGVRLRDVLSSLPPGVAVQGNLSPQALLSDEGLLPEAARTVLDGVPAQRHIFNLGHGILPQTDPARLEALIDCVRQFDRVG